MVVEMDTYFIMPLYRTLVAGCCQCPTQFFELSLAEASTSARAGKFNSGRLIINLFFIKTNFNLAGCILIANHYVVRESFLVNCGWSLRWSQVVCSNCFSICGKHYGSDRFEMHTIRIFSLEPIFLTNGVRTNILVKATMMNRMASAMSSGSAITLRQLAADPSGWPAGAAKKKVKVGRRRASTDVMIREVMSVEASSPLPSTSFESSPEGVSSMNLEPSGLGKFRFLCPFNSSFHM